MNQAEHRKILEAVLEAALKARNGDARAVAASLGDEELLQTLASAAGTITPQTEVAGTLATEVPLECPGQYTRLHELGRGSQSVALAVRIFDCSKKCWVMP